MFFGFGLLQAYASLYAAMLGVHQGEAGNSLVASLYVDADTFHAPSLSLGTLQPSLFGDGDSFYVANIPAPTAQIAPDLFTNASVLITPFALTTGQLLNAGTLVDSVDTFYVPVVTFGALLPSLLTDGDTFYTATKNIAPAITSGATADAQIGQFTPFYTITATDVELASLTYDITGADAAFFECDPITGAVSLAP